MESQTNQNQTHSTFSSISNPEIQIIVLEPEPPNNPLITEDDPNRVQLDPPKRKKAKRKRKKRGQHVTHRSSIKCPICLEQHVTLTVTTLCGHQFCRRCIYRWLTSHHNCPICRRKLRGPFSKKIFEPRQPQAVSSQAPPPDLS